MKRNKRKKRKYVYTQTMPRAQNRSQLEARAPTIGMRVSLKTGLPNFGGAFATIKSVWRAHGHTQIRVKLESKKLYMSLMFADVYALA